MVHGGHVFAERAGREIAEQREKRLESAEPQGGFERIDAFAVGVSFAFMTLNIWLSVIIIGVTTGLFSAAGLYIGRAFGSRWQKPAQIAGGIVLILIGVKVLFEHLGFLG